MEVSMDNQDQTKIAKRALWVSIISLIVSAIISLFTFAKTNQTSRQLLEYQLEQERLPRIMALNYELPVEIIHVNNGDSDIDFSYIQDELLPIKIPIYNVGVGFAQNCSIVWDKESINDACANMARLLSRHYNVYELELSDLLSESSTYLAYQDYIFCKQDSQYDAVRFCKYKSSIDDLNNYDCEFVQAPIICEDIQLPYLLPVLNQPAPAYVSISEGLSILLLEIANKNIYEPVSFCFDVNYQDLTGLKYTHSIKTTFQLCTQDNIVPKDCFNISFEPIY